MLTSADGYQDIAAGLQNRERTNTFNLLVLLLLSLAFQFEAQAVYMSCGLDILQSLKGTRRACFAFVYILLSRSWHKWARNWSISVLLLFGNFIFQYKTVIRNLNKKAKGGKDTDLRGEWYLNVVTAFIMLHLCCSSVTAAGSSYGKQSHEETQGQNGEYWKNIILQKYFKRCSEKKSPEWH